MIRHFPCCNMGRCFCERLQISAFASENQCQSQTDAPLFKKPLSSTDQRASTRCDISYPPKLTPQNCTLLDTCLRFVLGEPRSTETWSRNSHKGCRTDKKSVEQKKNVGNGILDNIFRISTTFFMGSESIRPIVNKLEKLHCD